LIRRSKVVPSTEAKTVFALFCPWTFGDRSHVVRVRLLVVIGVVIAFAIVGAGWKWQKTTAPPQQHLAGWSWDGAQIESDVA
jgi:hypothetical protein